MAIMFLIDLPSLPSLTSGVPCWVPGNVTEERPSLKHPVKPVYEVSSPGCRPGREELEREEMIATGDPRLGGGEDDKPNKKESHKERRGISKTMTTLAKERKVTMAVGE